MMSPSTECPPSWSEFQTMIVPRPGPGGAWATRPSRPPLGPPATLSVSALTRPGRVVPLVSGDSREHHRQTLVHYCRAEGRGQASY